MDRGGPPDDDAKLERFFRETLESFASERVAADVLKDGLVRAGRSALPTGGPALIEFVEKHLHAAAVASLGEDTAAAARDRLRAMVEFAVERETEERMTIPGGIPASMAEEARTTREVTTKPFSVVLVAGLEPDIATQLKAHVDSRTAVIPVDSAAILMRDLRLLRQQARLLIVDFRKPHSLLDGLRNEPDLLDGAAIVVWGGSKKDELEVKAWFHKATIVRCPTETAVAELATIVRFGPL